MMNVIRQALKVVIGLSLIFSLASCDMTFEPASANSCFISSFWEGAGGGGGREYTLERQYFVVGFPSAQVGRGNGQEPVHAYMRLGESITLEMVSGASLQSATPDTLKAR